MYMLIIVVNGDIETYIHNSLKIAQEKMLENIRTIILEDADWTEAELEDTKGYDWDTYEMSGWIGYDVADCDCQYKIVELPSMVVELL